MFRLAYNKYIKFKFYFVLVLTSIKTNDLYDVVDWGNYIHEITANTVRILLC